MMVVYSVEGMNEFKGPVKRSRMNVGESARHVWLFQRMTRTSICVIEFLILKREVVEKRRILDLAELWFLDARRVAPIRDTPIREWSFQARALMRIR